MSEISSLNVNNTSYTIKDSVARERIDEIKENDVAIVFVVEQGEGATLESAIVTAVEGAGYTSYVICDANNYVSYSDSTKSFEFNDQNEPWHSTSSNLSNAMFSVSNDSSNQTNDRLGVHIGTEEFTKNYNFILFVVGSDGEGGIDLEPFPIQEKYEYELGWEFLDIFVTPGNSNPDRVTCKAMKYGCLVYFNFCINDATEDPDWDASINDDGYIKNRTHYREFLNDDNLEVTSTNVNLVYSSSFCDKSDNGSIFNNLNLEKKYTISITPNGYTSKTYREVSPFEKDTGTYKYIGFTDSLDYPSVAPSKFAIVDLEYSGATTYSIRIVNSEFGINSAPASGIVDTSINIKEVLFDKSLYDFVNSEQASVSQYGNYLTFTKNGDTLYLDKSISYTVSFAGTSYPHNKVKTFNIQGLSYIVLGNAHILDSSFEDTGENFVVITTQVGNLQYYGIALPNTVDYQSAENSTIVSIYSESRIVYHKIDERYLPISGTEDGTNWTSLTIGDKTREFGSTNIIMDSFSGEDWMYVFTGVTQHDPLADYVLYTEDFGDDEGNLAKSYWSTENGYASFDDYVDKMSNIIDGNEFWPGRKYTFVEDIVFNNEYYGLWEGPYTNIDDKLIFAVRKLDDYSTVNQNTLEYDSSNTYNPFLAYYTAPNIDSIDFDQTYSQPSYKNTLVAIREIQ